MDFNYFVRNYTIFSKNEAVEISIKPENCRGIGEKELIIDGKYYDIKSFEKQEDGSVLITASPDKFDTFLSFIKCQISKDLGNKQSSPIHSAKSKNTYCWIDTLSLLKIVYCPRYCVIVNYFPQIKHHLFYGDRFRPPKNDIT